MAYCCINCGYISQQELRFCPKCGTMWETGRLASNADFRSFTLPDGRSVCAEDSHDFVKGGALGYQCRKCAEEVACSFSPFSTINRRFYGSYVDGCSAKWHPEDMDVGMIVRITVSFGNFPVRCATIVNNEITYMNRIHGSRDGGRCYPPGFFDKKKVRLGKRGKEELRSCLAGLNPAAWETPEIVFENVCCPGFFASDTFSCEFKNGKIFDCQNAGRYAGFQQLTRLIERYCNFKKLEFDK